MTVNFFKPLITRKSMTALAIASAFSSMSMATFAAEDAENIEDEGVERIEVTGSRIKRTSIEGVTPIVTISAADIQLQGHANVFDALDSLAKNTGIFVGEESSNNFNANAQAINLRGFGASYTLTLINGRRIPVLPKPSGNVAGNIVNLAMIPTEAVKRVEILSGGASAIYGSDAVAGVVNVILKDDIDFNQITARYGDTKDGGGASKKFTLSTGGTHDKFSYTAVLEVDQRDPIHGDDRGWFDEPEDGPNVDRHGPEQVMSYWAKWEPDPIAMKDLSGRCEPLGYEKVQPPGRVHFDPDPYYCGDNPYNTYTVRNERDRTNLFVNAEYELDDGRLFATFLGTKSEGDAGLYRYSYGVDYVVQEDINDASTFLGNRHFWRRFRNFEVPTSNQEFDETSITGIVGIEGVIADEYDYSLTFTTGQYDYEDTVGRFDDQKMLSLLYGEKGTDWTQPWEGSRWVVVNASQLNANYEPTNIDIFGQLTPDMFTSALHQSIGKGDSYLHSLSFDISGSLIELPAGEAQFAFVTEYLKEGYEFITDEETVRGDIYGWSGITGKGDRERYAAGLELSIPLAAKESTIGSLEATLAGRYDYYDDESNVDGAFTYQAGLSWRPMEELLIRTMYSTSFRAPDMHYMYAGESSSFASPIDYLTCVNNTGLTSGQSWSGCGDDYGISVRQESKGDLSLEEETGDSLNIGLVASITDDWSVTFDYYEVSLEKKIGNLGASSVLRYEAECMLGFTESGQTVDKNSAKCQEMLNRVSRGGPSGNDVLSTVTSPFNTGEREQKGIDISSKYTHDLAGLGRVFFNIDYTHIFETNERFLPEDELEDIRDYQWNNEFRTRTTATLGWNNDDLSVAFFVNRLGTSPVRWSDDVNERYPAWTTVNMSTTYHISDDLTLSAAVTNLFDKKPHQHESEEWWPFADITKYNPVGLEYFITATYRF
ncbi:TonB-dependent receptor [Thalassotalea sp. 1_MG-2023]|uniref:TonB-dependent receptor plug domain-containing protein n=1 Tax=Thalassotalea sp. 1_MG-2023 TaxID=3062680 RepID=UPI0026E27CAF|nr:TonB-dependent receptor [Thalassotalea sp. 1_MG-2023]MDO6425870.1 TonB-dependent receptor [Thalassotalea sp. 1_MG-2023]